MLSNCDLVEQHLSSPSNIYWFPDGLAYLQMMIVRGRGLKGPQHGGSNGALWRCLRLLVGTHIFNSHANDPHNDCNVQVRLSFTHLIELL